MSLHLLNGNNLISSAIQCAEQIKDRCIFVHGGSGGVGSSLLKILLSMREVIPEYKGIQIAASCSKPDTGDKLLAMGVDKVFNRTTDDFLDNLRQLNNGKGPDVIFEMLANLNLPKDLVNKILSDTNNPIGCSEQERRDHYYWRSRSCNN